MPQTRAWSLLHTLGSLLLGLTGCIHEDASKREQQCDAICHKFVLCDDRNDAERCQRSCEAELYWSEAYWDQRERCVEERSCNMLPAAFDELPEASGINTCIDDELRRAVATREQVNICRSMSTKLELCDDRLDASTLEAQCMHGPVRQLSPAYLRDSEDCIAMRCPEIQECLDALAESYDADVRLFEGELQVD